MGLCRTRSQDFCIIFPSCTTRRRPVYTQLFPSIELWSAGTYKNGWMALNKTLLQSIYQSGSSLFLASCFVRIFATYPARAIDLKIIIHNISPCCQHGSLCCCCCLGLCVYITLSSAATLANLMSSCRILYSALG